MEKIINTMKPHLPCRKGQLRDGEFFLLHSSFFCILTVELYLITKEIFNGWD